MNEESMELTNVGIQRLISLENNISHYEKPYVGQLFVDLDEVYSFYRNYARTVGFDIRKSSQKAYLNKDVGCHELALKTYACNKQGAWMDRQDEEFADVSLSLLSQNVLRLSPTKRRRTGSFRCGCKALLTVKLDFISKMWSVILFKEEHNHPMTSPTKKHYMKHSREIFVSMSNYIDIMESIGFSTAQTSRLITTQSGGYNKTDAMTMDIYNFKRDKRKDIKNYDAEILLEHFKELKKKDGNFYYAYKTDEISRLTHLVWADVKSKQDYELFREAVTFDTKFKTNQYHMIFAGFCGINHHRQTVFFGSSFIINETKDLFVWLFEEFLKCMGNKAPNVIITDQDRGMKVAISLCLQRTIHRLRRWHILFKLPVQLGALANKKEIMSVFGKVVWMSSNTDEFENGWMKWIAENCLDSNEWLSSIYELRHQWVPIYLTDMFSTGMKTTPRSEGMNASLRSRVTQYNTLYKFVVRYEQRLSSQREKENHSDHMDRNTKPVLLTNLTVEKQASAVYTGTIFNIFQSNLKDSLLHGVCQVDTDTGKYTVFHYETSCDEGPWYVNGIGEENEMPNCACQYFEFIGIPCSHILVYINFSRIQRLPEYLIKKRWTKGIKDGIKIQIYEDERVDSKWNDYTELSRQANELINVAIGDQRKREILICHLNQTNSEFEECGLHNEVAIANDTRISTLESRSGKRSITMVSKNLPTSKINVKNPPMAKKKGSGRSGHPKLGVAKCLKSDFEFVTKKARMCKKCGILNAGHDFRNCPSNKNDDVSDLDSDEDTDEEITRIS